MAPSPRNAAALFKEKSDLCHRLLLTLSSTQTDKLLHSCSRRAEPADHPCNCINANQSCYIRTKRSTSAACFTESSVREQRCYWATIKLNPGNHPHPIFRWHRRHGHKLNRTLELNVSDNQRNGHLRLASLNNPRSSYRCFIQSSLVRFTHLPLKQTEQRNPDSAIKSLAKNETRSSVSATWVERKGHNTYIDTDHCQSGQKGTHLSSIPLPSNLFLTNCAYSFIFDDVPNEKIK